MTGVIAGKDAPIFWDIIIIARLVNFVKFYLCSLK
jgi:hypothetical protein